ncbi:MAG: hypothetical protein US83_C0006G0056 [Candidatus Falkowbacteria bacterium GW2011_GWC2_38_22]|uniref:Uncharacterized protein n=1 Tax=Candidatus Falkowbacteria bacterium GW2011_GWE1_38_31 TaxID=1618638 RepID=A0A0G0K6N1_9BACT|nr:MAG: hypothetical protein US73_C0001G0032 [Candidatus Falkowbacteria bacterium GW2011_GWF2_38_1205]KKQ61416.1 MAG: hypothetical protein US83_C0006G0056 [Candidatus Falkowbacteria bacterium GW2011_GWC2_38_22]KKQ64000.1 MAG: hypothetical protein US84_C0002G0032 [Candidatus Falkowbacteria bacterium GW2011_GWF1_38_22]KKQ66652.1 MAG: hypothetical protein US87_C0001G0173 [Candidatus Falkowbacteria bacterium GW2011_GWE2_38_254]KKQ71105.1 MAG: hypothetical protein US91_C0001G0032 [Candidatus Falkowb
MDEIDVEHGRLYWFWWNARTRLATFLKNHKLAFFLILISIFTIIFVLRAFWQPVLVYIRMNMLYFFCLMTVVVVIKMIMSHASQKKIRYGVPLVIIAIVIGGFFVKEKLGFDIIEHATLYAKYKSLNIVELSEMPLTDNERIQPINSVYTIAKKNANENFWIGKPHFVRGPNGRFQFTIGLEPNYWYNQYSGNVKEVYVIDADKPQISFSQEHRHPVLFFTGENLKLGKNVYTNVIKTFGLWRFLNYETCEAKYIVNDQGNIVQVVSLIRWSGFFPTPEFGGVCVISQTEHSWMELIKTLIFGQGKWIKPEEIKNYPFLVGQNLTPNKVSRFIGESFRFQKGFFAPLPGIHWGDIQIPDMAVDMHKQPFTTFFKWEDSSDGSKNKLYSYFALEPYQSGSTGLNTSVMIPGDGIGPVYVCRHADLKQVLNGPRAIVGFIENSRKEIFQTNKNHLAEIRPWIKRINGKSRFFWLGTPVTRSNTANDSLENNPKDKKDIQDFSLDSGYIVGSIPEVAIAEADSRDVVWVDALKPKLWIETVGKRIEYLQDN